MSPSLESEGDSVYPSNSLSTVGRMAQDGAVFAATQRAVTPPPGQEDAVTDRFLRTTQLNNSTWTESFFTELHKQYPYPIGDSSFIGPFQTGLPLYDRLSLIFTDAYFSSHMKFLMTANSGQGQNTFGYLFNQLVPTGGAPRELGGTKTGNPPCKPLFMCANPLSQCITVQTWFTF